MPHPIWQLSIVLALLCLTRQATVLTNNADNNTTNTYNDYGDQQFEEIDLAKQNGIGATHIQTGQTTRIFTNGDVDDDFWLKHLGEDFKNAVHLQVGGGAAGQSYYDNIYQPPNPTNVQYRYGPVIEGVQEHKLLPMDTEKDSKEISAMNPVSREEIKVIMPQLPIISNKTDTQYFEEQKTENSTETEDNIKVLNPVISEAEEVTFTQDSVHESNVAESNTTKSKVTERINSESNATECNVTEKNVTENIVTETNHEKTEAIGDVVHSNSLIINRPNSYDEAALKYQEHYKKLMVKNEMDIINERIKKILKKNRNRKYSNIGKSSYSPPVVVNLPDIEEEIHQNDFEQRPNVVKMPPVIYHGRTTNFEEENLEEPHEASSETKTNEPVQSHGYNPHINTHTKYTNAYSHKHYMPRIPHMPLTIENTEQHQQTTSHTQLYAHDQYQTLKQKHENYPTTGNSLPQNAPQRVFNQPPTLNFKTSALPTISTNEDPMSFSTLQEDIRYIVSKAPKLQQAELSKLEASMHPPVLKQTSANEYSRVEQ